MFNYVFIGFGVDNNAHFREKRSYVTRPTVAELEEDLKEYVLSSADIYNYEHKTNYSAWDGYWRPASIKELRKNYKK